jgi:hypothetical protein
VATSQAACSIAKIIRLIGPIFRHEKLQFSGEFDLAEKLVEQDALSIGSLEEELGKRQAEQECLQFIRFLLTLDPLKRPTANEALEHSWLRGV